jgi:integrase/recombinase XerD
VRAFFKWLTKQNVLLSNPASELELPRLPKQLPRNVMSASEVEAVLAVPDVTTTLGIRDRAMMEVLYSTGIRRLELVGLAVFDIDHERGTLLVREGKGRKDRMVPIGARALAWVRKYVDEARDELARSASDTTLFLSNMGDAFEPDRVTELVRDYVNAADVGKKGACHMFRHSMATLMLEHGADIRIIQEMLGHSDLSSTQLYAQVSIRHLKAIHEATHPAATLARTEESGEDEDVAR